MERQDEIGLAVEFELASLLARHAFGGQILFDLEMYWLRQSAAQQFAPPDQGHVANGIQQGQVDFFPDRKAADALTIQINGYGL